MIGRLHGITWRLHASFSTHKALRTVIFSFQVANGLLTYQQSNIVVIELTWSNEVIKFQICRRYSLYFQTALDYSNWMAINYYFPHQSIRWSDS